MISSKWLKNELRNQLALLFLVALVSDGAVVGANVDNHASNLAQILAGEAQGTVRTRVPVKGVLVFAGDDDRVPQFVQEPVALFQGGSGVAQD